MKKSKNQFQNVEQFRPYLDKMDDSSLKSYIIERVIKQIDWYDEKSCDKQSKYKGWSITTIILNGIVPVAVLLSDFGLAVQVLIATLSSAAGVIGAFLALANYKDLWIQYRMNCEALKSTLYSFFLRSGGFDNLSDDAALGDMLVSRCEDLLTTEFRAWSTAVNVDIAKPTGVKTH